MTPAINKRIHALGFTSAYICDLDGFDDIAGKRLETFIGHDYHGSMSWMKETLDRRKHPQTLWPDAKSAIMLGMNYGPDLDPLITLSQSEKATISVYARNRDYHDVMKGRLKEIAGLIARDFKSDVKVFVDTAPLMEKPLAQFAGLGWQGKHTNLVSREIGSWFFIGSILTTAKLRPTQAEIDHCGSCQACLDICPTDAFPKPYQLDARKCISYLTIEHDGPVDIPLREKMGNRIYGCDDCLAVCPWNKFAQVAHESKLIARDELKAPDLAELITVDEAQFRKKFAGSPIKRIGWVRFIRNVIYAIGNSKNPNFSDSLKPFLSHSNETLNEAANWASNRINYKSTHS